MKYDYRRDLMDEPHFVGLFCCLHAVMNGYKWLVQL